jgi:ubiquinone/menaquinone biosynthesis C-methylase UbiE
LTTNQTQSVGLASRAINRLLAIKPLAKVVKMQARRMMIARGERLGVHWRNTFKQLQSLDWDRTFAEVNNPELQYPDYYLTSFHAYDTGNLSWEAAWEVESAAYTVHSRIWGGERIGGDKQLRDSYRDVLKTMEIQPLTILDLGCGVGMSTFELSRSFPQAKVTGVDLSPYFLSVAKYNAVGKSIDWVHAAAEATGLPERGFDLVSACLMFHELPQSAAKAIIKEANRLLRPGGYLGIMDMNPRSPIFQTMPPYILTLLKSTEPYLDEYFALNFEELMNPDSNFTEPTITINSPRHRTIMARRLVT